MNLFSAFFFGMFASGSSVLIAQAVAAPIVGESVTLAAAAIVTVIAALGGVIVQIINASSASRDRREAASERKLIAAAAAETGKKADTLIEKTAEIHTLTNSTNSNLQKALEIMTEKFQGSERTVATMEATRKETAAVQAMRDQSGSPSKEPTATTAVAGIAAGTAAAIVQTADNTRETANNTARTEAKVNELKDKP